MVHPGYNLRWVKRKFPEYGTSPATGEPYQELVLQELRRVEVLFPCDGIVTMDSPQPLSFNCEYEWVDVPVEEG